MVVLLPESPRARRPRAVFDLKEGTPKKSKQCNCKNSRCLKLYCKCFTSGTYCDGCNCINCCNNVENDVVRQEVVEATLERNPNAFRPKIASSPSALRDNRGMQWGGWQVFQESCTTPICLLEDHRIIFGWKL